jgi:hypothetical protein
VGNRDALLTGSFVARWSLDTHVNASQEGLLRDREPVPPRSPTSSSCEASQSAYPHAIDDRRKTTN